jgi:hypothetical protein
MLFSSFLLVFSKEERSQEKIVKEELRREEESWFIVSA